MSRFKIRPCIRFLATGAMIGLQLLTCAHSGEHQFIPPDEGDWPQCVFGGAIVLEDIARLRENAARGCKTLYVTSAGGNLDAALALGRIAREAEMTVVVERAESARAHVFSYMPEVYFALRTERC
jgi:hypothetical protein